MRSAVAVRGRPKYTERQPFFFSRAVPRKAHASYVQSWPHYAYRFFCTGKSDALTKPYERSVTECHQLQVMVAIILLYKRSQISAVQQSFLTVINYTNPDRCHHCALQVPWVSCFTSSWSKPVCSLARWGGATCTRPPAERAAAWFGTLTERCT